METTKPTKTISQVFEEFLADQKGRISAKTFLKYQSIIQLYESYLKGYWPGHDGEYDKTRRRAALIAARSGRRMPRMDTANSLATSCLER